MNEEDEKVIREGFGDIVAIVEDCLCECCKLKLGTAMLNYALQGIIPQ